MYSLIRPFLHLLDPERAHEIAIAALKRGFAGEHAPVEAEALRVSLFGLQFPNPVGLAAGFDKNAEAVSALQRQGFGFVELGTVTPLPQNGNPRPRIFRLPEDRAVINRLGFNNAGMEAFTANVKKRIAARGIIGANIGKNKDSESAAADYTKLLKAVYGLVDYVTINISSPNTSGLRDLQQGRFLQGLLSALIETRAECQRQQGGKPMPLLLKVAPDVDAVTKEDIAQVSLELGIDGIIVSNTTIKRPTSLKNLQRSESGGLSGPPLFELSTQLLKEIHTLTQGKIPLIGVGGISTGDDAYAKIRAGASLVQLYTALTYQGFGLVNRINKRLLELLQRDGFKHITDAVGTAV